MAFNILETVRDISESINASPNFKQAMDSVVSQIAKSIEADACSIFLIDEETQDFSLTSTTRNLTLNDGQWKIRRGEGLISRVAQRGEVLNLEDSQKEPLNLDLALNAEDDVTYHGFLAAPITHQGRLLGVLVTEKLTREKFSQEAVSFLIMLSAQLASDISNALITENSPQTFFLAGIPASSGVVIGEAVVVYPPADLASIPEKISLDIEEDIDAFMEAIRAVNQAIEAMSKALENSLSHEDQMLFNAYLQILHGNSFKGEILKRIRGGQWVQSALKTVVNNTAKNFESMEDIYLQERASDIRDIGRRVLAQLQSNEETIRNFPADTILVGTEITASMLAEIPHYRLKGVISGQGSANSHVSILARALNVPAAMGVKHLPLSIMNGKEIILDGYTGRIYLEPSPTLKRSYQRLAEEEREMQSSLKSLSDLPAETKDGLKIKLCANIGMIADIDLAIQVGGEGVGLYRTEVPFMILERFPSEEEQRILYRQVLQAFSENQVTMRVLDAGGDKILPYFHIEEANPYLGWRGIRMLLDHPEIFLIQIRAMLRASVGLNNLQIMLPMISKLSEVKEAKLLIRRAYEELQREHLDIEMPKIGVMIEVPSAIFQLEKILQYVDFISVGSNDLTQYMLAVDRNNARVERFYNTFHPSVLNAIGYIARLTKQHNKPLSLCGELASDPLATMLLVGMGFDSLSMNAAAIPRIKWVIRGISFSDCQELVEKILKMDRSVSIKRYLQETLIDAGFGGLVRPTKI